MTCAEVVVCGVEAGSCICGLPPRHPSRVHECGRTECGGQWTGDIDSARFEIVRLPMSPR